MNSIRLNALIAGLILGAAGGAIAMFWHLKPSTPCTNVITTEEGPSAQLRDLVLQNFGRVSVERSKGTTPFGQESCSVHAMVGRGGTDISAYKSAGNCEEASAEVLKQLEALNVR